jgi:hypothetical protein
VIFGVGEEFGWVIPTDHWHPLRGSRA